MPRRKKQPDPAASVVNDTTTDAALAGNAAESTPTPAEANEAAPSRQWVQGPHWFKGVALGAERDAPRVRLGRDNKFKQMAILFTEKPEAEVIEALHADGWTWRGKERYWTRQLDPANPATGQQDAERFFDQLADAMRTRRGLTESPAIGD